MLKVKNRQLIAVSTQQLYLAVGPSGKSLPAWKNDAVQLIPREIRLHAAYFMKIAYSP